jgi:hypothetical protein
VDANMDKITTFSPTQHALLAGAADRTDGAFDPPPSLKRGPARRSAASLIDRRLLRETRARKDIPVWRDDDAGRPLALVITKAGRDALRTLDAQAAGPVRQTRAAGRETVPDWGSPRKGTKIHTVLTMLSREGGASLADLIGETGWQSHTTRAALTGLRKKGITITRERDAGGASIYRAASTVSERAAV